MNYTGFAFDSKCYYIQRILSWFNDDCLRNMSPHIGYEFGFRDIFGEWTTCIDKNKCIAFTTGLEKYDYMDILDYIEEEYGLYDMDDYREYKEKEYIDNYGSEVPAA